VGDVGWVVGEGIRVLRFCGAGEGDFFLPLGGGNGEAFRPRLAFGLGDVDGGGGGGDEGDVGCVVGEALRPRLRLFGLEPGGGIGGGGHVVGSRSSSSGNSVGTSVCTSVGTSV